MDSGYKNKEKIGQDQRQIAYKKERNEEIVGQCREEKLVQKVG